MRKIAINCNLCGANDFEVVSHIGYPFYTRVRNVICKRCSLTYQNPIPCPEALADHYHNYREITIGIKTPTREYEEYAVPMALYHYSFFKEYCKRGMNILDIGCGAGTLMSHAVKDGLEAYGVNPDPGFGNYGPANYNLKEVQICLFEDAQFEFGTFDIITFNHVFEHFPDPTAVLQKIRDYLKEEGLIYLSIPNNLTPHGQLEYNYIDEHINTFTTKTIGFLLKKMGFKILKLSTYGYETDAGLHHPYIDLVARKIDISVPQEIDYGRGDYKHDLSYLRKYRKDFNKKIGWIKVYMGVLRQCVLKKPIFNRVVAFVVHLKKFRIFRFALGKTKKNVHCEPSYCTDPKTTEFPLDKCMYFE